MQLLIAFPTGYLKYSCSCLQTCNNVFHTQVTPDDGVVATFGGAFACEPVFGSCASVRALHDLILVIYSAADLKWAHFKSAAE